MAGAPTIYLDNNATTRPDPRVVQNVHRALTEFWHNPSSVHRPGQAARQQVELARQSVARLINAQPRDITFTSGATEALDLAIRGTLAPRLAAGRHVIITSPIEHEAVRDLCKSLEKKQTCAVRMLPVGREGVVDISGLEPMLSYAALVCVQWANNETGVIQPVMRIGEMCRAAGVPFVCDATQWVGKMLTNVEQSPIDLLCMSAHKFHGPKGVGALYTRRGMGLEPVIHGTQERERRGGTENVPGILGMGVAADIAADWLLDPAAREKLAALRDRFEHSILDRVPGTSVNATRDNRLWNTTNIAFPKLEAEALLLLLSERGLCASAGAACSSGSLDPSPVLLAMGIPEPLAHGSLRFSLSRDTTAAELEMAVTIIAESVERLRGSSASALA